MTNEVDSYPRNYFFASNLIVSLCRFTLRSSSYLIANKASILSSYCDVVKQLQVGTISDRFISYFLKPLKNYLVS